MFFQSSCFFLSLHFVRNIVAASCRGVSSSSGQKTELSFPQSVWAKRNRSTQAVEMSFLLRVDGLSGGDSTRDMHVHGKVFWA